MRIISEFEIVKMADNYILVPVGDQIDKFNGTVVLNETSAFLIEKLRNNRTIDELIGLLIDEFDVSYEIAQIDVKAFIEKIHRIGIMIDG